MPSFPSVKVSGDPLYGGVDIGFAVFQWLLIGFGFLSHGANGSVVDADPDMPLSVSPQLAMLTTEKGQVSRVKFRRREFNKHKAEFGGCMGLEEK